MNFDSDGRGCLQYGRPRFNPWAGKIPWGRKWQPYSSVLAWNNSVDRKADRLQTVGLQRVRHDWVTNIFTYRFKSLEMELIETLWQRCSIFYKILFFLGWEPTDTLFWFPLKWVLRFHHYSHSSYLFKFKSPHVKYQYIILSTQALVITTVISLILQIMK